jgi:hypothetical protein
LSFSEHKNVLSGPRTRKAGELNVLKIVLFLNLPRSVQSSAQLLDVFLFVLFVKKKKKFQILVSQLINSETQSHYHLNFASQFFLFLCSEFEKKKNIHNKYHARSTQTRAVQATEQLESAQLKLWADASTTTTTTTSPPTAATLSLLLLL